MPENTKPGSENTPLELASATAKALLLRVNALVQSQAEEADPDMLERLMKLGQRASDLLAECRKLEKAQGALAQGVTRELVVAWAKQQPKETRLRVVADLQALDVKRKESVLS